VLAIPLASAAEIGLQEAARRLKLHRRALPVIGRLLRGSD
jgi:hypothetical protein